MASLGQSILAFTLPVALLSALPASVEAASVTYSEESYYKNGSRTVLTYSATAGETNDLSVSYADGTYTFVDLAATIEGGDGCVARTAHEVACARSGRLDSLRLDLADGDDRVKVDLPVAAEAGRSNGGLLIQGGPGADRLDVTAVRGRPTAYGGEGDDLLVGAGEPSDSSDLSGGAGADEIFGGFGRGALNGGSGDDILRAAVGGGSIEGGGGIDRLLGGPGDDFLSDSDGTADIDGGLNPIDADVLEGAGGRDTVSYYQRFRDVWVDLSDTAPDGSPGEFDDLSGFEDIAGGFGDDTLTGNGQANFLRGAEGQDTLTGAGGADLLFGESGFDRLFGGPGGDGINAGETYVSPQVEDRYVPGFGERVSCGPGRDHVGALPEYESPGVDAADELDSDCEDVTVRQPTPGDDFSTRGRIRVGLQPTAVRPHAVSLRLTCLQIPKPFDGCRGVLSLAARQRARARRDLVSTAVLGAGAFDLERGRPQAVTIRLSRRGREFLARRGARPVQVQIRRFRSTSPRKLSLPYAFTTSIGGKPR